jgi:hypothetical protein
VSGDQLRQRAARALGRPIRPDEKLERTVADLVDVVEQQAASLAGARLAYDPETETVRVPVEHLDRLGAAVRDGSLEWAQRAARALVNAYREATL